MISLTNILTGQVWEMPDSINAQPLYLGRECWPPGDYDINNGSSGALTVVYDSKITVVVPAGRRWAVSSNENLYSWFPVAVDFAGHTSSGLFRGMWWAGWAPVFPVGNI